MTTLPPPKQVPHLPPLPTEIPADARRYADQLDQLDPLSPEYQMAVAARAQRVAIETLDRLLAEGSMTPDRLRVIVQSIKPLADIIARNRSTHELSERLALLESLMTSEETDRAISQGGKGTSPRPRKRSA